MTLYCGFCGALDGTCEVCEKVVPHGDPGICSDLACSGTVLCRCGREVTVEGRGVVPRSGVFCGFQEKAPVIWGSLPAVSAG